MLKIKIKEGLDEAANVAISSIAVVLHGLFGSSDQFHSIEDAEKVSSGQVIMPIVAYEPKRINLKTTAIKNTFLNARYSVYSKMPEEPKKCSRFILEKRHLTKDELLKALPAQIRDATFEIDGEQTFLDVLCELEGIKSDRVHFFYDPVPAEGYVIHPIAVIHEFGKVEDPYCIATAYFSIEISK